MKVNIQPYWHRITDWYYNSVEGQKLADQGCGVWTYLDNEYGIGTSHIKARLESGIPWDRSGWVVFPNESAYVMFLMRWS